MKPYSKNFIDSFVNAYSRNVACASDEAVRVFLQDYTDNMGWERLNDRHEYGSNILMHCVCLKQGWHSRR